MEEDYWKLISRVHWLNEGDSNTKFFHITATNKKRRNKIIFFKDSEENWIDGPPKIMEHTYSYFQHAFTSNYDNLNWNSIKYDPS